MLTKTNEVPKYPPIFTERRRDDSTNDQTNDDAPNDKLKSLCNAAKAAWMPKYGTGKFLTYHMNYVLVEAWGALKVSASNIIRDISVKKKLPPLSPPFFTKNTQACAASIQVSSGSKAE